MRKGYRIIFLAVFIVSLLTEVLLFLFSQIDNVNVMLKDDFRIVLVKSEMTKVSTDDIKGNLEKLEGVKEVVYVNRDERLRELIAANSDFSEIITLLGRNPIPDTFEIVLDDVFLGDLESWITLAWKTEGISDIKYKPLEAYIILHTLFYSHFIFISFVLAIIALIIMVVMVLVYKFSPRKTIVTAKRDIKWFFAGSLGSFIAVFSCYAIVYPIKYLSPIWSWPNPLWHILIIFLGGFMGWTIHQWKITH
ncbi:MAG: permease-like cell division protein FtsX [Elusimicrobia bacterium]|nr:permease-like cell division protein FtsX [Elusimicrobiota bacterium]